MLLPLAVLERRDPEATVAVFPSDHWISSDRRFMRHVERAADAVERWPERIAVLGIQPTRPDPECGYLTRGWPLELDAPSSAFTVGAFFERPDASLAERLARRGGLWNSSVMVFRVDTMLAELERLVPERLEMMRRLARKPDELSGAYAAMERWSFGRDVFARLVESLVVVPVARPRLVGLAHAGGDLPQSRGARGEAALVDERGGPRRLSERAPHLRGRRAREPG
jgi:mannose-1-phosphate guanylyltransferase